MAEAATYERDGHVATITYNRPDALNAIDAAMRPQLPWVEAVRMGETMRRVVAQSEDAAEGRAARAEGRVPRWRAR